METPVHLHIYSLASMAIPVKFCLNFLITKWASAGNIHIHPDMILALFTRTKWHMANERWRGWIDWSIIMQSTIGNWRNKQISTANTKSNDYNGPFESKHYLIHCAFSGPFAIQCKPIHAFNCRVAPWLPFHLRNKNHLVSCLSQCDALRRMIYWKIISNYFIDITWMVVVTY